MNLRSQPEKQQEAPKRDEFKHALSLVDDVIYCREENGDDLTYDALHEELENLLTIHESNKQPECGACTGPDPLDELDRRCAIAAREYTPDPEKGEWASDSHRDPFNEVREWIAELRQRGKNDEWLLCM